MNLNMLKSNSKSQPFVFRKSKLTLKLHAEVCIMELKHLRNAGTCETCGRVHYGSYGKIKARWYPSCWQIPRCSAHFTRRSQQKKRQVAIPLWTCSQNCTSEFVESAPKVDLVMLEQCNATTLLLCSISIASRHHFSIDRIWWWYQRLGNRSKKAVEGNYEYLGVRWYSFKRVRH
jgi:hypothetical protein